MYKVCAAVNDVKVREVPLDANFDLQVDDILASVDDNTKLIFVCSPGNPTAKSIPLSAVSRLLKSSYRGLVVVDEAYVDFSPEGSSAVSLLLEHDNVVVLHTLSKAFGLAGIRCGFAIAAPCVAALMNAVKAPYNLSSLSAAAALDALKNVAVLAGNVALIQAERERVCGALRALPFVVRVCHSDANFLLFELRRNAKEVYKRMADGGVVTRYRGMEMHCEGCIRTTIGRPEENDKFLAKLVEAWGQVEGKL